MKATGSIKQKNVSKAKKDSSTEIKGETQDVVWEQIKLEDLEQERSEVRKKSTETKTTAKKTTEKKSVSAAKAAVDTTAEVTAAEVTAEEPIAEAIETEEPKTEEPAAAKKEPKTRTRSTAAKKEEKETKAKVPAAKKEEKETKTKTTTKTVVTEKVVFQKNGKGDMVMSDLIDRVKAAYVAEGHKADSIKNIEVYVKIDENMAYYVIDGYASGISLYE